MSDEEDTPSTNVGRVLPPLKAGAGPIIAIVPQTFEDVQRIARMTVAAGIAPRAYNDAEDVAVAKATAAIMHGMEVGVSPMQALQNIAVINGRTVMWGELLVAVLRSHGFKVRMWTTGTGDSRVGRCTLTRPDGEVIETSFSVAQAKQARLWDTREVVRKKGRNNEYYEAPNDSAWFRYPEDMLEWKALARANRRGGSDATRGLMVRQDLDELHEMRDVTPLPQQQTHTINFEIPEDDGDHEQKKPNGQSQQETKPIVERDVIIDIPDDDTSEAEVEANGD